VAACGHDRFVFELFAAAQMVATKLEVHSGRPGVGIAELWHGWPSLHRSDTGGASLEMRSVLAQQAAQVKAGTIRHANSGVHVE
jgi:hypothetical protein